MKLPSLFVPEKSLEKKTLQLTKGQRKTFQEEDTSSKISPEVTEKYYWKYINSDYYKNIIYYARGKPNMKNPFTVEKLRGYFKKITEEDALKIIEYNKIRSDRFLEGLADIP